MTYSRTPGTCSLGVVGGSWGQIVSKDGSRYQITDNDVLWAARAAQFEGHDAADTLWTWTQRYALPNFRSRYPTLADLIQAHSQPVNPIWRRDGSKCRPGAPYHGTEHCSESRLARRDQAATLPFDQVRSDVKDKALRWATAKLPNPVPKSIDFAAPSVAEAFVARNPGSRYVKQSGNWFISTPASQQWAPDQVTIHHEGRVAGPGLAAPFRIGMIVGGIAVAGAAGFAAWSFWRSR